MCSAGRKRQSALAAGCLQKRGGAAEEGAGQDVPYRGGSHTRTTAALPAADHAEHATGNIHISVFSLRSFQLFRSNTLD